MPRGWQKDQERVMWELILERKHVGKCPLRHSSTGKHNNIMNMSINRCRGSAAKLMKWIRLS